MVKYPRTSPRYTVRLSDEEHSQFQRFLSETGRNASSVIREAMAKYLTEQELEEQERRKQKKAEK
jgi:predicted DNA-binding protein